MYYRLDQVSYVSSTIYLNERFHSIKLHNYSYTLYILQGPRNNLNILGRNRLIQQAELINLSRFLKFLNNVLFLSILVNSFLHYCVQTLHIRKEHAHCTMYTPYSFQHVYDVGLLVVYFYPTNLVLSQQSLRIRNFFEFTNISKVS